MLLLVLLVVNVVAVFAMPQGFWLNLEEGRSLCAWYIDRGGGGRKEKEEEEGGSYNHLRPYYITHAHTHTHRDTN